MKRNSIGNRRYVYDALYGIIYLPDFVWKVIPCPELQHLREVRLCDINSLCLTGGANINRYEHAIGTCYLASECVKNWPSQDPIDKKEEEQFLLAALLHDIVNTAFGHSVEHVESIEGFEHEKSFLNLLLGKGKESYRYKAATLEPIYFGLPMQLASKILTKDLEVIGKIIAGEGRFGPLISGTMDLDNIDNVFRLAYHIGIVNSGGVPLNLARSLWVENSRLVIRERAVPYAEKWFNVRERLYSFLLLNPEEFSGKCMLREAIELAKEKKEHAFNWYDTDYLLLTKLSNMPLVRQEIKDYLFSISTQFEKELNNGIFGDKLLEMFKQRDHKISSQARVKTARTGWKILDKAKQYFIEKSKKELRVYKLLLSGVDVSKIIQRLMKGELYGCIGIFSTSKIEKKEMLRHVSERRDLEDGLSSLVKKIGGKFKYARIALHLIVDVNKTRRKIHLRTDTGRPIEIGEPSRRLIIGAFFKNPTLNMYEIDTASGITKRIKEDIKDYLSVHLEDPKLEEVELYAEAKRGE